MRLLLFVLIPFGILLAGFFGGYTNPLPRSDISPRVETPSAEENEPSSNVDEQKASSGDELVESDTGHVIVPAVEVSEQNISLPSPLVYTSSTKDGTLTADGIFAWTNVSRVKAEPRLRVLGQNPALDEVAQRRLSDMFEKQYFEHISPTGIGAADIARDVGYQYIGIGENIALGNFENDAEIVEAWMNSPGHRANIVGASFMELGVAVGEGLYDGRKTWIGVQIFARPLSACTPPDSAMRIAIEQNQNTIRVINGQLKGLYAEIESLREARPFPREEYNNKVEEYNALVGTINALSVETKAMVELYNTGVRAFNVCVES